MQLYLNPRTDPRFNLALEEVLLETAHEPLCLLWRNARAVIIGKNQNAFTEVDLAYTAAHNIAVVRRLSGGGAVFHDVGNVNFTFILPTAADSLDFARFTDPIIEALRTLGVEASRSGRNDLVVTFEGEERKISGNAQCVYTAADGHTPTLHHGTLLYDADLSDMQAALRVDPEKLSRRGIASVRSRVANLRDLLTAELRETVGDAEGLMRCLAETFSAKYRIPVRDLAPTTVAAAETLAAEKYATDAWNLRRMGDFAQRKAARFPFGRVEISLTVEAGRIADLAITGDFFGVRDVAPLADTLIGLDCTRAAVEAKLREADVSRFIHGASPEEIAALICG